MLFVGFKHGAVSYDDIAKTISARVSRICKAATYKYGIRDECSEDISQELLMMLPKLAANFDEEMPVEPLLIRVAGRLAYAEANKTHRTHETTYAFQPSDEGWGGHRNNVSEQEKRLTDLINGSMADEMEHEPLAHETDRKLAIAEMHKKLYDASQLPNNRYERFAMTSPSKFEPPHGGIPLPLGDVVTEFPEYEGITTSQPKKVTTRKKQLTEEQEELVAIRHQLHLSQPDFAAALEINVPRLSAYEYGRTNRVPADIMTKARQLRDSGNKVNEGIVERYGHLTMSEILKQWADAMLVAFDDTATLAGELGTTETTIRRWKNNDARPGIAAMVRYEQQVKKNRIRNERIANTNQQLQMYSLQD